MSATIKRFRSLAAGPRTRWSARDLALVAMFVGIVAALGLVPALYPFGIAVPITAQTLGVMLAGAVLGGRRGALALAVFLVLVAVGLPLLAGGRGGLAVFVGPSAGFLWSWPLAAFVVGWITERAGAPYRMAPGLLANLSGGLVVVYVIGIPVLAWLAGTSLVAAAVSSAVFVVGDVAKAVLAAVIARGVHAAYPGLLPVRTPAGDSGG
ncbi:biotin transport system substrate-specific component [Haloechinothrix alba]|uniref:Biotin transporter n=1 Tax=Haloechinothrix alba TaxID=664784 RepID=A0A238YW86_9PSEU|nr:biotin transporter BioY [Haloechinothrix alba]SNR75397.1 biotin transport system substrate-specific component [Haloechinothrix alba]